jgi:hypothetical protein
MFNVKCVPHFAVLLILKPFTSVIRRMLRSSQGGDAHRNACSCWPSLRPHPDLCLLGWGKTTNDTIAGPWVGI